MKDKMIEFFSLPDTQQRYWLAQIEKAPWRAAAFLGKRLRENDVHQRYGEQTKLFLLTRDLTLVGFCTFANRDELPDDTLYPWVGFVFVSPEFRGNRYSQVLVDQACTHAKSLGYSRIYLSSNEIGLYEKYGFTYLESKRTVWKELTRIYVRDFEKT